MAGPQKREGEIVPLSRLTFRLIRFLGGSLRIVPRTPKARWLFVRGHYFEAGEVFLELLEAMDFPFLTSSPWVNRLLEWAFVRPMLKPRAVVLGCLGAVADNLGNTTEALSYVEQVRAIAERLDDNMLREQVLHNLGVLYGQLGEYHRALACLHQALEVHQGRRFRWWPGAGGVTDSLAVLYALLGDYDRAKEYALRSVEDCRGVGLGPGEGNSLLNLGAIYSHLDDETAATECWQRALQLGRHAGDRRLTAMALNGLGMAYYKKREMDEAEACLEEARALCRRIGYVVGEAWTAGNLGHIAQTRGDFERARSGYREALEICGLLKDQSGEEHWHFALGQLEEQEGDNPEAAWEHYQQCAEVVEDLRRDLWEEREKIPFAEVKVHVYEALISLGMRRGRPQEAFSFVQRAKGRALVDLLSRQGTSLYSRFLPAEKRVRLEGLKGTLRTLKKRLAELYGQAEKLKERQGRADGHPRDELTRSIVRTEEDILILLEEVLRSDPGLSSLVSVSPPPLAEVRGSLDRETALVEYYQTEDELFTFVLRAGGELVVHRQPVGGVETGKQVFALLSALRDPSEAPFGSHDYVRRIQRPLREFYQMLIEPIREVVAGVERLLIAPHLLWHYLPFHALYDGEDRCHLIDRFELCYVPSASVLPLCRQQNHGEKETALILANATGDLPWSEEEARTVASCFGPTAQVYRNGEATLARLQEESSQYDVVHIACHGSFRGDRPFLSALRLSDGNGGESLCLLPDLFGLRLRATLVALSACDTGLHCISSGDELIGLGRGLLYAGAPSLLLSLWSASDRATASLIGKFYRAFIGQRATKSWALQRAMQEIKGQEEHRHPYFWAPFLLMGDWR